MREARREQILGLLFVLVLVGGALLRVTHLGSHRFHVDEALFSSYGLLIAFGLDPLLQSEAVDKPPLFFYVLALSFRVFGNSETAAAIPSLVAGLGSVALVFYLCRRLYGSATALIAAALMAASPFNVAYAYTAFIDPTMVAIVLLAMALAERRHFLAAGFTAGLLPAIKVQGLLFLPAVALMGALGLAAAHAGRRRWARAALCALPGFVLPLLALATWSSLRPEQRPFTDLAAEHNPLVPADPATYAVQMHDWWLSSLQFMTGSPLANWVLLSGVVLLLAWSLADAVTGRERRRAAAADWGLAGFVVFFLAWHTYYESPTWDRYMLGIVPFGLVLFARALLVPWRALTLSAPRWVAAPRAAWSMATVVALFLTLSLAMPVRASLQAGYKIGWSGLDGPTTYQGIHAMVNYFKGNVAPGATIYDYQTLSWHYKYYMFGFPYYHVWFDDNLIPSFQQHALTDSRSQHKYIVLPSWVNDEETREMLAGDRLSFVDVYRSYRDDGSVSFTVYRIEMAE